MHQNASKTPSSAASTELADASGRLAAMALAIALNYVGAPPDLPTHEQFRCSEKDYDALCAAIAGAILEASVRFVSQPIRLRIQPV